MGPLTVPDYLVVSVSVLAAAVGVVIGFSGAIAFLSGLAAAVMIGYLVGPEIVDALGVYVPNAMVRGAVAFAAAIIAFGAVRWAVAKCVHGLVAQPGDAILGAMFAAVSGLVVSLGIVWVLEMFFPYDPVFSSAILDAVRAYVSAR